MKITVGFSTRMHFSYRFYIAVDVVQKLVSFAKESPVINLVLSSRDALDDNDNVKKRGRKRKLPSAEDIKKADEGTNHNVYLFTFGIKVGLKLLPHTKPCCI